VPDSAHPPHPTPLKNSACAPADTACNWFCHFCKARAIESVNKGLRSNW